MIVYRWCFCAHLGFWVCCLFVLEYVRLVRISDKPKNKSTADRKSLSVIQTRLPSYTVYYLNVRRSQNPPYSSSYLYYTCTRYSAYPRYLLLPRYVCSCARVRVRVLKDYLRSTSRTRTPVREQKGDFSYQSGHHRRLLDPGPATYRVCSH